MICSPFYDLEQLAKNEVKGKAFRVVTQLSQLKFNLILSMMEEFGSHNIFKEVTPCSRI